MKTQHIASVIDSYIARSEARYAKPSLKKGLLQILSESLQPGGLNLVGGRPGMGCTTLVLSMALELAKAGKCILFYGHPHHDIEARIMYYFGRRDTLSSVLKELQFHYAHLFYTDDFQSLKSNLCEDIITLKPDYIFIDCIQDIPVDNRLVCNGMTGEEYICRELRDLAFRMEVPITAVARLNRNPEKRNGIDGKVPQLGDFRGGDLAYYASCIYFPYRPEYYHIYYDERTGEDIRDYMYVHNRNCNRNWATAPLKFDVHTFSVYDPDQIKWINPEEEEDTSDLPF